MKHKNLLLFILTASVVLGLASVAVFAENTNVGITHYSDILTPEELACPGANTAFKTLNSPSLVVDPITKYDGYTLYSSNESVNALDAGDANPAVFTTYEEGVEYLRTALVNRENTVSLKFVGDIYDDIDPTELFYTCFEHTGVPNEGDYIMTNFGGGGLEGGIGFDGSDYYLTLTYTLEWYTTYEMELEMDQAVDALVSNIESDYVGANDESKVFAVYNYMCKNMTYDYDGLAAGNDKMIYTAYAAMMDNTAVCQGFASLFYRLCLELGIDCRVITGTSFGEGHAWNIVKIGDVYYNVDSTWDLGMVVYDYYLCTDYHFDNHTRDEEYTTSSFYTEYPMASSPYEALECQHSYNAQVIKPTCTEGGYTVYTCKKCENSFVTDCVDALGHDMHIFEGKAPTCTEIGWNEYEVCYRCYLSTITVLPATGHSGEVVEVVDPTCLLNGYTIYVCHCGYEYQSDYVDPTGHSYEVIVVEPTCTEQGYTVYDCHCGYGYEAERYPATGHTFTEETTPPTCTEQGYTVFTCHCGYSYIGQYIDAVGHQQHTLPVVEPTCTEDGYTERTICTKCDLVYKEREVIPATGHTPGTPYNENFIDPTCTENGSYDTVVCCSNVFCSAELSRETMAVPAKGHNYHVTETVEPTCTSNGYSVYTCTECRDSYVADYVDETEHKYGQYHVSEEATCTQTGKMWQECADCGAVIWHETAALDHDMTSYNGKEPTCIMYGWKPYESCSRCDYSTYEEIPATGHTAGEAVIEMVYPATCYSDGSYDTVIPCTVCEMEVSRKTTVVPATDHSLGEWIAKVEVTCLTDGESGRYCLYCDYCEMRVDKALGHDIVKYEAKEPTCTEDGWDEFETCTRGDLYTREIKQATGHTHGEQIVENETAPSCTVNGSREHVVYCTVCDHEIFRVKEEIPSLGHTITVDSAVEPTCTETGLTEGKHCSVCNEIITAQQTVSAPGHDFAPKFTVDIEPTYESVGQKSRHCSRCDSVTDITVMEKLVNTAVVFSDVKNKSWFRESVDYVVSNGLMNGTSADKFEPNTTMSRAMLVTVLWRLEGEPEPQSKAPFTDLKQAWYKNAVAWAYENNIVNGTSDTQFSPNGNITREQMAAILYRYSEYRGDDTSERADISTYPDAGKISKYARDAFSWANAVGLITGTTENGVTILAPRASATRAQVAIILTRFCKKS